MHWLFIATKALRNTHRTSVTCNSKHSFASRVCRVQLGWAQLISSGFPHVAAMGHLAALLTLAGLPLVFESCLAVRRFRMASAQTTERPGSTPHVSASTRLAWNCSHKGGWVVGVRTSTAAQVLFKIPVPCWLTSRCPRLVPWLNTESRGRKIDLPFCWE